MPTQPARSDAGDVARERAWRDAAAGGQADAWHELFDGAYDLVNTYVYWRVGGLADLADDVVQEAWLVAARRVASFNPAAGPFAGWVCGIAANVIRNHLRDRRRAAARFRPFDANAVSTLDEDDSAERIALALARIGERHERVLRAKYLDGQSVIEIAAAWGESPKAIESLLSRARQAFRELYASDDPP